MASDWRQIGLDSIAIGTARSGSGMPATMVTVGAIVPDSCVLALETPSKNEMMVEDSDFPDIITFNQGAKVFSFSTRDIDPDNFALGLGGNVSTGGTIWRAPNDAVIVNEVAVRAISKTYNGKKVKIEVVHANLRQGGDLRFAKAESGVLNFEADVLRPAAANTDHPIVVHIAS